MKIIALLIILTALIFSGCSTPATPVPPAISEEPLPTAIPPTATVEPSPTVPPANFTITGRIDNLGEFGDQIVAGSLLQLVHLPGTAITDQTVALDIAFNEDGIINIITDSASIPVPADGNFIFELESLEPGLYLVIVQFPYIEGNWVIVMALTTSNEGEVAVTTGDLEYNETTNQFIRRLTIPAENFATFALADIPANAQVPFQYDFGAVFISKLPVRYP
jgi:hypothetical protein